MTGETVEPLRGVLAPILTPFNDDLTIAHDLYIDHALRLLDEGCAGLVPFGTTGEATSIAADERANALWHLMDAGIDPEKLMPGTGFCSLKETAEFSRACLDMGCRAVMTLPPFFYKSLANDGLYAWYARLIELVGADLRLYLYHIPQVAGVGLPVPLVQKLRADFPDQIVGIKDSSGKWENTAALLRIEGLTVYSGTETALPDALPLGSPGCISATANVNAAALADFVAAYFEEDELRYAYLRDGIFKAREEVSARDMIPTPKRLLAQQTGDVRWANVRPPLIPAPDTAGLALGAALAEIG